MNIRLRCPVCGMLTFLRNIGKEHEIEALLYKMGGRYPHSKRGILKIERQRPKDLRAFWIKVLEEVLARLKAEEILEQVGGVELIITQGGENTITQIGRNVVL